VALGDGHRPVNYYTSACSNIDKATSIGISSGRDTSDISSTLLKNFEHSAFFFLGKDLISELKVASFGSGGGGWRGEEALGEPFSSIVVTTLATELQSYSIRILLHENSVQPSNCCTFSFEFCVVTHYYSATTRYNSAATLSVTLLQLTITML
jgi:hypothetical protein